MTDSEYIPINDGLLSPKIVRIRKYDDRYLVEVYTKSYDYEVKDWQLKQALEHLDFRRQPKVECGSQR